MLIQCSLPAMNIYDLNGQNENELKWGKNISLYHEPKS